MAFCFSIDLLLTIISLVQQAHQDVFQQLVDLIGITSIMEVGTLTSLLNLVPSQNNGLFLIDVLIIVLWTGLSATRRC